MSDANSNTSAQSTTDGEMIKCRICNQSDVELTINPWNLEAISLAPSKGHLFNLLAGTHIRIGTTSNTDVNSITIHLIGDPIPEPALDQNPIKHNVHLTLMPGMSLELIAPDATQITLQPVYPVKVTDVKCWEGP